MATTTAEAAKANPGSGDQPAAQIPAADKPAAQAPAVAEPKPGDPPVAKPEGSDAAASKAPEKYALTLPDGDRLDAADLKGWEALARAEGWTNEEAQTHVNAEAARIDEQSKAFRALTESDPIYGGPHMDDTTKLATAALDKLRPKGTVRGDAFRALLHKSGYGNQLEVVSLLADLGKLMAEDTPISSGAGLLKGQKRSDADVLFGDAVAADKKEVVT